MIRQSYQALLLIVRSHGIACFWTLAPTYSQAKQAWNEMKAFVPDNLVRKKFKHRAGGRGGGWNEDDMEVWLDFKDETGNWLDRYRRSVYWLIRSADNYESLQTV